MTTESKKLADATNFRRVFQTPEEAVAYLTNAGESYEDFADVPLAAPGIDSEGNLDPAVYGDDMEIVVTTLKNKAKGGTSSLKALVVFPSPKLSVLLSREDGLAWVTKIIHKELNHVAVRALREAEDVSTVVDQMPTTLEGFITSGREGGAGLMESFNELYKPINALLSAKAPVWAKAKMFKNELKRAMESRGYALEFFPALEDRGTDASGEPTPSLFVRALQLSISAAKKKGLDPAIFERWLATRDQKTYTAAEQTEDEFDLDDWTDSLLSDDAEPTGDEPAA
jgi:hypothetical protein